MAESLNMKHGIGQILTEKDIEILKKSSNLNEEEIRITHAEFWEEFPDGKMSKEGFIKYYQLISNDDQKPKENDDNAFTVFDENHDGVIDFAEFLFMLACDYNSELARKYGHMFETRNTSGNGQMNKNELIVFITNMLALSGREHRLADKDPATIASITFNLLGAEENETVNKEQFIIGCIKYPILVDLFNDQIHHHYYQVPLFQWL
ncbi:unnamed protein product [Rotaria socialis]